MFNSKQPLVSIIIPVYNGMPYLEQAIESVLAQDYPNIELIVLDDGSKDGTAEFLKKYQDRFYFEVHPNMGQAATLNKGWQMSKGEILGYLSADDIMTPDAVRVSVEEFLKNPQVILTYPDNNLIDSKSRYIRRVYAPDYDYLTMVSRSTSQVGVASFFLRRAFQEIGGWNINYRIISDYEYQLRLAELGKFQHINQVLGYYRVHEQSTMYGSTCFEVANEFIKVMEAFLKQTKNPEILLRKKQILAAAYLWSARTHWRSGRFRLGYSYFLHSIQLFPKSFLSLKTYRIILNALINRSLHRVIRLCKDISRKKL